MTSEGKGLDLSRERARRCSTSTGQRAFPNQKTEPGEGAERRGFISIHCYLQRLDLETSLPLFD